MRKSYDTSFKAKVAMEAVRNENTLQELSQIYGVHPNQIAQWKEHVVEQVATLFERSGKDKDAEAAQEKQDELFKQIGQLQVENAFLKKNPTGVRERAALVEADNQDLSIVKQCTILGINRSAYYYTSVKSDDERGDDTPQGNSRGIEQASVLRLSAHCLCIEGLERHPKAGTADHEEGGA